MPVQLKRNEMSMQVTNLHIAVGLLVARMNFIVFYNLSLCKLGLICNMIILRCLFHP